MARVPLKGAVDTAGEKRKLQAEFEELQSQYRSWGADSSAFGRSKRAEFALKIRNFPFERAFGREELVDVTVHSDPQGFNPTINQREYTPGTHRVPASVAQQLLYMMDQATRSEAKRMQDRGRNVSLGEISAGERAAMVSAED